MKPPGPRTKVATHFLPASDGADILAVKTWIDDGAIGTLREIHNWSNRPMWPQYPTLPTDPPPIPEGFDWTLWVAACKGGKPTYGDFLLAGPISDAFNLGAVSLRLGGRKLVFDAGNMKVTHVPEANQGLVREYRKGWELAGAGG